MSELTSERRLFGTDGVRGEAETLLTDDLVENLGRAAVEVLGGERTRMVILRDTRKSGKRIEAALARGAAGAGADVKLAGVLPTPAAPLLVERYGLDVAAVVSASHNPWRDNGIKFFGADGLKLSDEIEAAIESRMAADTDGSEDHGSAAPLLGAEDDYLRALHERFADLDLSGMRLLLDTANGATHRVAPAIMRRLGAETDVIFDDPDGVNINDGCGSTHLDAIRERARAAAADGDQYDACFAFDGDGDRVLAIDGEGRVHDGDELLALAALHLRESGRLRGDGVAVTVMSNYGFHRAMADAGIEVAITPVGDRYVLAALIERDWALGGEQSGHIIERGFAPSGDGTASALLTLEALHARGVSLRAVAAMEKLPQRLVNVRVADREAIESATAVWQEVERAEQALAGRGRVLVRPSGTEPLVRVMAEAPSQEEADAVCARLAQSIERELG